MPIITIAGSSGFIKYEIKTGTFGISFYIYALGLSAYVIILIFRIFLAKLKISQKLLGYCLLIFLLSASFDISVETGFIKSPLISPFAGLIFVACIFVTFIIEEQQNFKKISDINLYLEEEIARKTAELKEKQDELIVLASTDPLTGLTNRQEFIRQLEMEKKKIDRYGEKSYRTFVLIFIDLDNFKYFNDSFGHDMGDYILKIFSRFLKSNLREVDFIARYGGDEFILLLPYTNMDEAIIVMNRCYNNLKKCDYFDEELKIYLAKENIVFKQKIGFSAGLVMYEKGVDVDDLLKRSDRALYAIKRSSKNNYRIWKPDDQDFLL
jgi:diguanylate cyclase (GGDEF)-like protein